DEWAENEGGGAHGLHQFVGSFGGCQVPAADGGAMLGAAVSQFDFGAHGGEEFAGGFDVAHLRDVFENNRFVGEQGGGHGRERGVLGAADADGTEQRIAAANYKLIHTEIVPW